MIIITIVYQVLGLTASPGINKAKTKDKAAEHIKTLMANLHVFHLSTVVDEKADYNKYFDEPQQGIASLNRPLRKLI